MSSVEPWGHDVAVFGTVFTLVVVGVCVLGLYRSQQARIGAQKKEEVTAGDGYQWDWGHGGAGQAGYHGQPSAMRRRTNTEPFAPYPQQQQQPQQQYNVADAAGHAAAQWVPPPGADAEPVYVHRAQARAFVPDVAGQSRAQQAAVPMVRPAAPAAVTPARPLLGPSQQMHMAHGQAPQAVAQAQPQPWGHAAAGAAPQGFGSPIPIPPLMAAARAPSQVHGGIAQAKHGLAAPFESPTPMYPGFMNNDQGLVQHHAPISAVVPRVPQSHFEIDFKELEFGDLIGHGAFGQVFRGLWRGTKVAIKMLMLQHLNDDIVSEFTAEVAVLSALRHPNIILFMGACTTPPQLCIITELATRGSLWGVIHSRTTKLEWPLVLKMATDTARGMAFLHSFEPAILHRDLKSGNLLVDDAFNIKLSDFGLSRVKARTATMTGKCGTYQWMAPEVLGNERYSEKADVYSFGIVCWEMLTSQCPFENMNEIQVALAVISKGYRPEIPPSTPPGFAQLITTCWDRRPESRPSFRQILTSLETFAMTGAS